LAEEIIPGLNTEVIRNVTSGVADFITALLFGLVVAAVILFFWFIIIHKKRILLFKRYEDKGRLILAGILKVREVRDKNKAIKWKTLFFNGLKMSQPPNKSILPDIKGREVAMALLEQDNIVWLHAKTYLEDGELEKIRFDPLTSENKTALAHEFRESETYKKKRGLDLLLQLAPTIGIIILVVIFLLFSGDFIKSVNEQNVVTQQQTILVMDKQLEVIGKLDVLINNRPLSVPESSSSNEIRPPN